MFLPATIPVAAEGSGLATITDAFGSLMWIGMVTGLLLVVFGGFQLALSTMRGDEPRGWITATAGLILCASNFLIRFLLAPEEPTPPPGNTVSETPRPTPTPPAATPETPSEPADLTWLLITIGVIAALILVALLAWLIITLASRARRGMRTTRARAEADRANRDRIVKAWQGFHERHDELLRKILHAETDWDALFFTPALSDPSVPQTYAMLRAMREANTQREISEVPLDAAPDADLAAYPYPAAVERFALAWDTAERHARRVGQRGIPHAERKVIKQIRTLLDIAENSAASQTERDLAYRRVQGLLESLESIHVPDKAIAQLEQRQRLMITAGAPESQPTTPVVRTATRRAQAVARLRARSSGKSR